MTTVAYGQNTADGTGTAVTSGDPANTKGSWVELAASTSIAAEWIEVYIESGESDVSFLIDIGVGAAASESVVIPNISYTSNLGQSSRYLFPLTVASGSRISARAQSSSSIKIIDISIHLGSVSSYGTAANCINIGADTANSVGTTVDPGGTANTKGSWTQISSSTSADMDWLCIMVGPNTNPVIGTAANFLIDIGVGAAASESVVIPNLSYSTSTFELEWGTVFTFFQTIAAGSRVAVRAQCTDIDATDRIIDVTIIGCNMTAPSGGGGGTPKQAGRGGGLAG